MDGGGKGGKFQMCLVGIEGRTCELVESHSAVLGGKGVGHILKKKCLKEKNLAQDL